VNRQNVTIFVLVAVFALSLALVAGSGYWTTYLLQQRIAQLERDSDESQSNLAEVQDRLVTLENQASTFEAQVDTIQQAIDMRDEAIQDISSNVAQLGLQAHTVRERLCEKLGGSKTSGMVCPTITKGTKVIKIGMIRDPNTNAVNKANCIEITATKPDFSNYFECQHK
jgi:septal ring factor EnvC (AmiA/AmiB activator)